MFDFHYTINLTVKHGMKSVTGAELLCAGLSGLCVHPLCLHSAHYTWASPVKLAYLQCLPVCLRLITALSETASQLQCKTVITSVLCSGRVCHINTSLFGTVLLRSILWLAGEKPGVFEQAVTVTAKVWCIGNSIPAPQNSTLEEARLTWGNNPTVHKRCVVLITVHRSLLITRLGALH